MPLKKQRGKSLMQNDMNRNSEEINNYSEEDYRRFFSFINSYREFIENKSKEELQQLQELVRTQKIRELEKERYEDAE